MSHVPADAPGAVNMRIDRMTHESSICFVSSIYLSAWNIRIHRMRYEPHTNESCVRHESRIIPAGAVNIRIDRMTQESCPTHDSFMCGTHLRAEWTDKVVGQKPVYRGFCPIKTFVQSKNLCMGWLRLVGSLK